MEEYILNIIKAIRESWSSSVVVYTYGCCYQFYEILKAIFPTAESYWDGNHIFTKIDGEYYDIKGKFIYDGRRLTLVIDKKDIDKHSVNKWSDERRSEYIKEYQKKLNLNNNLSEIFRK